jgi:hypothetical protein
MTPVKLAKQQICCFFFATARSQQRTLNNSFHFNNQAPKKNDSMYMLPSANGKFNY